MDKFDILQEVNEDMLVINEFEDAIIGYVEGACRSPVALYDKGKCIEILCKRDEMTLDEAYEYLEYNVLCAYVGEMGPLFATLLEGNRLELEEEYAE